MQNRSPAPLPRGRGRAPLYLQLCHELQEQIARGEFAPGEQLPSEYQLSATYEVSRHVVRQALSRLVAEGQVVARHGSGYFVNRQRVRHRLPVLTSFTTEATRAGAQVGYSVSRQAVVSPPPEVAKLLCEPGDDRAIYLARVASLDGEPVAVLRTWYPIRYSEVLIGTPLDNRSVTALLLERLGEQPEVADSVISVVYAGRDEAQALDIPEGSALLNLETTARGQDGKVVEFSISAYRSDRLEFLIEKRHAPH